MSEVAQAAPRRVTAAELVESMRGEMAKALPPELSPDTFLRLALTEIRMHPVLSTCSRESLLGALMTAARLGLEPGGPLGQFYLTPRRLKNEGMSVVSVVGYRGLIALAYRSGIVRDISAHLIRAGDTYREGASSERGGSWYEWEPQDDEGDDYEEKSRPIVGVVAIARLTNGGEVFKRLKLREIEARRRRGAAGDKGPWSTDYEAMVLKTGIRALIPLVPQSTSSRQLVLAERVDEQVQHYDPKSPEWAEPVAEIPASTEPEPQP